MAWRKMKVQIERTTTEFADVDFDVDMDEYMEWLGGWVPNPQRLVEFIKAHRDYPQNLPIDGAGWVEYDVEYEVKTP